MRRLANAAAVTVVAWTALLLYALANALDRAVRERYEDNVR